jgi:heme/copper-type cytochrome/quinol oxidase subunit 2
MKMKIIVESEAQFNQWLAAQKTFKSSGIPVEPTKATTDSTKMASN